MENKAKRLSQKIRGQLIVYPGPNENSKRLAFQWNKIVPKDTEFMVLDQKGVFASELARMMTSDAQKVLYRFRFDLIAKLRPDLATMDLINDGFNEVLELLS